MEGLKLIPAWQNAKRSNTRGIWDYDSCDACRAEVPAESRRDYACGYEPTTGPCRLRLEGAGIEPTVCPGYSTSLPETIEIARGWSWAERGCLRDFCGGPPTDAMLLGVELFGGAINELNEKKMTPRSKGGLRDE